VTGICAWGVPVSFPSSLPPPPASGLGAARTRLAFSAPAACRSGRLEASRPTTLGQPGDIPAPAGEEPAPHRWPLFSPAAARPTIRAPHPFCSGAPRMRHTPTARRRDQSLRGTPGYSTALRPGGGGGAAAVPRGAGAAGRLFAPGAAAEFCYQKLRRARRPRSAVTGGRQRGGC